jgi:hypothetical protein
VNQASRAPLLVLDTNAWVSRQLLLLNTPLGAAMLFSLQRKGGVLGLPEVIEKELSKILGSLAVEAAQKFDEAASILDDLGLYQVHDPQFDLGDVRQHALDGLEKLEPFIVRSELTLAQARGALARVIAEQPPNSPRNQQFKDSLIWEAIVHWSDSYNVTFITGDKGFFEGRQFSSGVAEGLRDEARHLNIVVYSLANISTYLAELSEGLTNLEEEGLRRQIWRGIMPRVEAAGEKWNFKLGERRDQDEAVFLTRTKGALAVQFSQTLQIKHRPARLADLTGTYSISGSCLYLIDEDRIDQLTIDSETIHLEQPSGKHLSEGTYRSFRADSETYIGPRLR